MARPRFGNAKVRDKCNANPPALEHLWSSRKVVTVGGVGSAYSPQAFACLALNPQRRRQVFPWLQETSAYFAHAQVRVLLVLRTQSYAWQSVHGRFRAPLQDRGESPSTATGTRTLVRFANEEQHRDAKHFVREDALRQPPSGLHFILGLARSAAARLSTQTLGLVRNIDGEAKVRKCKPKSQTQRAKPLSLEHRLSSRKVVIVRRVSVGISLASGCPSRSQVPAPPTPLSLAP